MEDFFSALPIGSPLFNIKQKLLVVLDNAGLLHGLAHHLT